jgi:hypothetical protein
MRRLTEVKAEQEDICQFRDINFVTPSDWSIISCDNFGMANKDQIRPLAGIPDHGFGLLGRLVHSVLAEYYGAPLSVPRLHLGQNTLPNPPFPMAAQVSFGDLSQGWLECGEDLAAFLQTGTVVLRNQPIPDISAYAEEIRVLQRVLRFDSITMVWCDPDRPSFSLIALAVDRAGNFLAGWIPAEGTPDDIEMTDEPPTSGDKFLAALLHELLQAQYEWTTTAFGLVP